MNIQIFQVFHKDYISNTHCSWIKPIGVSGYSPEGLLKDNDGLNIANLNEFYCELTVLFYIWKNIDAQYVGLYHYRRYLNFKLDNSIFDHIVPGHKIYEPHQELINYLTDDIQKEYILNALKITDVIIPRKSLLAPSVKEQYLSSVEKEPWEKFEMHINSKFKEYSNPSFYFEIEKYAPICNMLIMKKEIFNSYCEDLFGIIDSIFQELKTPYDKYNNRYPGFLAERFLGLWLHLKKISYLEVPMIAMA